MNKDIYTFIESELLTKEQLTEKLSIVVGESLFGLPLRTRSKVVKTLVCNALGYDVPNSFRKTKPKFPCQNIDIYTQKSNNLQIWNDEIDIARRYVLFNVNEEDVICGVKVIDGYDLETLDTTGTLTTKYQARIDDNLDSQYLPDDVKLSKFIGLKKNLCGFGNSSNDIILLSTSELFDKITTLIGTVLSSRGFVEERVIADEVQSLVASSLGLSNYKDDGRFPDIREQLLEVKFQMSPTIDLGLHKPDSQADSGYSIDRIQIDISSCRYLVIKGARTNNGDITINKVFIAPGSRFFELFTLFGGKVKNSKLQIVLPNDFFD